MREFSWNIFAMSGNVDAYLLYKQAGRYEEQKETAADEPAPMLEQSIVHNEDKVMPYYMGGQECYIG